MRAGRVRLRQWQRKPNGVFLTSEREFSRPRTPMGSRADDGLVSFGLQVDLWASRYPDSFSSGATAVLLGSHQHFAVQLLLLFFKCVFYLPSLQTTIPRKKDGNCKSTQYSRTTVCLVKQMMQLCQGLQVRYTVLSTRGNMVVIQQLVYMTRPGRSHKKGETDGN